jgi:hypothetical protein
MALATNAQNSQVDPARAKAAEDLMQQVLSRSATDMEFRRQLLAEPGAAIAGLTGRSMKAPVNVRFIESKGAPTIVLPDLVAAEGELSESELEAVAGGDSGVTVSIVVTIVTAVAWVGPKLIDAIEGDDGQPCTQQQ